MSLVRIVRLTIAPAHLKEFMQTFDDAPPGSGISPAANIWNYGKTSPTKAD